MYGLKSILTLTALMALVLAAPASAQMQDMYGMGGMGGMWGMGQGMMGSPFGGMFPGMGMPFSTGTIEQYRAPAWEDTEKSVMATLESVPQLSMFTAALKARGYADKLSGKGNYVVFVTTDRSLERDLSVKSIDALLGDSRLAGGLADNSIVLNPDNPDENSQDLPLVAASGLKVNVRKEKTGMAANGADVLKIFKAANGYVIVTDAAVGT